jgi:citrate synthase
VRDALGRGEKIMGFGHRVYRTLDPRAPILKTLAEQLLGRGGDTRWLEISEIIQSTMREEMDRKGKKIYPNVDFFSASVYYTLGIPLDLFTNLFACARMSGWTAHVIEQLKDNRLIRPKAEYTGPSDRTVTAVAQRA